MRKTDYPLRHLLIIKSNKLICLLSPLLSPLTLPWGLFVRTVSLKGLSNRRWQPGLSPGRVGGRRLLSQFLPLGRIKKESMDSLAKYIYLLMHRQMGDDRPHGTGEDRNSGSHHTKTWVDLTLVLGIACSAEGHYPVLWLPEHLVHSPLGPKIMSFLPDVPQT